MGWDSASGGGGTTRNSDGIFAELHATLKGLKGSVDKGNKLSAANLQRLQSLVPVDASQSDIESASNASTVPMVLGPIAGPTEGRVQVIRRLTVGFPSWTTSSQTGSAVALQVSSKPGLNAATDQISTSLVVASFGTMPGVQTFSSRQIVLRNPDKLWMIIVGGINGQPYIATAQFEDYQDDAYRPEIEL